MAPRVVMPASLPATRAAPTPPVPMVTTTGRASPTIARLTPQSKPVALPATVDRGRRGPSTGAPVQGPAELVSPSPRDLLGPRLPVVGLA